MQDQNLTNTFTPPVPATDNAGVSNATMGIPNLNPPANNNPTPNPVVAQTAPATDKVTPGADVSTMGIPPLQPPADNATSKPANDVTKGQPAKPEDKPKEVKAPSKVAQSDMVKKIIEKIRSSENILIALSNNPSVDDIAAAIGLTLYLDGIQRHVTAIYSGRITEGLEFLQPEATFENNVDSLQDFIIALSKEKADHLRYKLEGDYVKVFITPYRAKITEDDLTFSNGEYNVDFVIALDVASPDELDGALAEHGRIMHSASTVNITTNAPGKFGDIDWSNPTASSVCEMVTQLILEMQGDDKPLDRDIATALLTGIVAATDRFSNNRTSPDTLGLASKLMEMGADQQLISANISGNEISQEEPNTEQNDNLMVEHTEELPDNTPTIVMPTVNTDISAITPDPSQIVTPEAPSMQPAQSMPQPEAPAPQNIPDTMMPPAEMSGAPAMPPMPPMPPTEPIVSTPNPAANLAVGMDDANMALGPEPADMSIPSMVPQENLMPPAVNGELADRPDSILPPPPMPPVDGATMAPPA